MRRWVWRVLLTLAVLAALTVGASAAEIVEVNGIRYDLDTGTVIEPVNSKTITQANIQAVVNNKVITGIADEAFQLCPLLRSVKIPRTVETIGSSAFLGCEKLESVELPDGLRTIPAGAFYNCSSLGRVSIPTSVMTIGNKAFFDSGLTSVTFPSGLTSIEASAFEGCGNLATVTFQEKVSGTALNPSITPVIEIKEKAFSSCKKLTKLTLAESVKSIGDDAFSSCENLKRAVVFSGTGSIGIRAFSGCPLTDVVIFGTSVTIGANAFQGTEKDATIHYAGTAFPPDALPASGKPDMVHPITGGLKIRPSISCTTSGSVEESLSCDTADCKYKFNEPARVVPPLPHELTKTKTPRTEPTCTENGQLEQKTCAYCNYAEKAISIPALGHDPRATDTDDAANKIETKKATCSEEGVLTIITKRCGRTGCNEPLESKTEPIPKTAHTYDNKDHILIETTCEKPGLKVTDQVCSKCNYVDDPTADCEDCKEYWGKKEPTDTETTTYIEHVKTRHGGQEIDALRHDYEDIEVRTEPTCVVEGKVEKKSVCKNCGAVNPDVTPTIIETLPITGHKWEDAEKVTTVKKQPTCTEDGLADIGERSCLNEGCDEKKPAEADVPIPKLGHDLTDPEDKKDAIDATCEEDGEDWLGYQECKRKDCDYYTVETVVRKKGPHTWDTPKPDPDPKNEEGEKEEDKEPTCGQPGVSHVIVTCKVCGKTEHQRIELPATGQHDWGEWTTKEPTATQPGEKKRTCKTCNKEDKIVLPATGDSKPDDPDKPSEPDKPKDYQITIVQGAGGTASANRTTAKKGDTVTVTVSPSSGYVVDMVRVITADGKVPALTDLGGGQYRFTMPEANVEIRATFERKNSGPSWIAAPEDGSNGDPRRTKDVMPTQNPTQGVPSAGAYEQLFRDIPMNHWAAGEINWANQMGYMNGTGGRFNPDGNISHQQMWMVLARLSGSYPANMTEARRWAVEHSFADGSSPTGPVLRHQLVTALYRCAHLMGSTNRNTTSLAGYPDSRTVPTVARDAFSWAVANGIVGGTGNGRLDPNGTLTRAQFAVILYRYSQRI